MKASKRHHQICWKSGRRRRNIHHLVTQQAGWKQEGILAIESQHGCTSRETRDHRINLLRIFEAPHFVPISTTPLELRLRNAHIPIYAYSVGIFETATSSKYQLNNVGWRVGYVNELQIRLQAVGWSWKRNSENGFPWQGGLHRLDASKL